MRRTPPAVALAAMTFLVSGRLGPVALGEALAGGEHPTGAFSDLASTDDFAQFQQLLAKAVGANNAPEAVPFLEKVLERYRGTDNVFGFAAAQALFSIGSDRAHAILRRVLLSGDYNTQFGLAYSTGWPIWKMEAQKRSAFIEQYHLVNVSNELALALRSERQGSWLRSGPLTFQVVLTNTTPKPVRLFKEQGGFLVLRDPKGDYVVGGPQFVNKSVAKEKRLIAEEDFPQIDPGKPIVYRIECWPRVGDPRPWVKDDKALVLDCGDFGITTLTSPGKYTAYALISVDRARAVALAENLGLPKPWLGTVVSKPVEFDCTP